MDFLSSYLLMGSFWKIMYALFLSGYFSILYFSWFVFEEHQAVQNAWGEACLFFFYEQVPLT